MARLAVTVFYAAVAGTTTLTTASSVFGTTTIPTTATTILACGWLCPRIDVLVNSWTRVLVGSACQNVAIAWNHRRPWRYYGKPEPAKCVEVHVFCCRACAYPPRRAGILNRIWWRKTKAYFRQCSWHCLKTLRVCVRKHCLLTCALPRTNSAASKIDILFGCRILRNDKRLEDGSVRIGLIQ